MALNAYIRQSKRSQINYISLNLQKPGKEKSKTKGNRRK
jgi:hypothetical protein